MPEKLHGNGHVEPCRDLKSLEKLFEEFKREDFEDLKACVGQIKGKTVPRWVFVLFVSGLVTISAVFITWHVSAIKTITFEATSQQMALYKKIDELRKDLVDLRVEQTRFNTIQQQVIITLRDTHDAYIREKENK
jgi:hypothetical protein